MQIKEAIILAGGLGTRLRDTVPDLPKCMAPVNGTPLIGYVIQYLTHQGIERFIFSLGYRSNAFTQFLSDTLPEKNYTVIIEDEPLGTGGAIRLACRSANDLNVLVVNGDSIFKNNLFDLASLHFSKNADCTLALKPMQHFERYGAVELKEDHHIALFKEKQLVKKGLINAGVYIINVASFLQEQLPEKFSFEIDYLQKFYTTRNIVGLSQEGYFIDIGIPEDYLRAQIELK